MPSQPVGEMLEVTLLRLLVAGLIGVDQYGVPNFSFPFRSAAPPSSGGIGGTTGTIDNAITRADGTGGSTLQGSLATITDQGYMITVGMNLGPNTTSPATVATDGQLFAFDGAGVIKIYVIQNGGGQIGLSSSGFIAWGSTADALGAQDLFLVRDAANTLALRNGASAQTLIVQGSYTDSSNYWLGRIRMANGDLNLECTGAGTNGSSQIVISATSSVLVATANVVRMTIKASGVINIASIPTSSSGLSSGDVWSNLGILTIVA